MCEDGHFGTLVGHKQINTGEISKKLSKIFLCTNSGKKILKKLEIVRWYGNEC